MTGTEQHPHELGSLGRLGRWTAIHRRRVFIAWALIVVGLGIFAPRVEKALSGAGWEASGSESVVARAQADQSFGGASSSALQVVVHADGGTSSAAIAGTAAFDDTVSRASKILAADNRVAGVVPPQPGVSISPDGTTAIITGLAAGDPNEMVRAADDLKQQLAASGDSAAGVSVDLSGASGLWSDFNQANKDAMLKSELVSWPVTLAILLIAFGSLMAAGLPLMLTIVGLVSAAGLLFLGTKISPISIWAMNFALMFALALGIDYALFIVVRFRNALLGEGLDPVDAVARTMETAGKAVLFSGLTVLVSLTAVMMVPSPAFRSMALGIMLAVISILAATLTLLPAVLAKLGPRINRFRLPWAGDGADHRSHRFERWAEMLWRRPAIGLVALVVLGGLAIPVLHLDTGMPSIKVVPESDSSRQGYTALQAAFGPGAPGRLDLIGPAADAAAIKRVAENDPGIANVAAPQTSADERLVLVGAVPTSDPSDPAVGATIDRLRTDLPAAVLVGGTAAENHDLEASLASHTPFVIAVVLGLGFLLLLVALQSPVIAAVGVLTNLLAVGAAFGVAKWIFQDGDLSGLLGFESQGFLDAWGPVFFFAMIFAISMDYTVFLLSSAREHWEKTGDAHDAMVGGLAHSGRVIFAAAGVMVAVFFTFALSGPLPPKEMGVILGVAVLLDAFLVRLILLPVILRLLGPLAWWLPAPLRRILPKVSFGH